MRDHIGDTNEMIETKQTAVEWLYETIDNELIDFLERRIDLNELSVAMLKSKQKALKMEKQQILEFWQGGIDCTERGGTSFEQYYNETYKK